MMPGAQESTIIDIEQRLSNVPAVSKLVEKGLSPEEILYTLLGESNVKLLETKPVQFNVHVQKKESPMPLLA